MVAALALVVLAVSADAATAATSVAVVCNAPQVRERIALSGTPQAAISAGGSTWVLTRDGQAGSVIRVDPIGGTAQVVIRVSLPPWSFGYGFGSLWVVGQKEGMRGVTLLRIDPAAGRIVARVQDTHFGLSLAVTSSAVWLSGGETAVHRVYGIDPRLNRVTRIVLLGKATTMSLQARGDQLWSAGWHGLVKIVRGNVVATARIRPDGTKSLSFGVAFAGGTVWSAQAGGESFPGRPGALVPISAATGRPNGELLPVPLAPTTVTAAAGDLWVAAVYDIGTTGTLGPYVLRVDPARHRVQQVPVPGLPRGFVVIDGHPWVLIRDPAALVRVC